MTPSERPVALVVDDDQDTIDLLRVVLSRAGFSVFTATNAAEGIALARVRRPVLATVDVNMPGMDGLEATRRIREFSKAYIVIISTRSRERDILAGFDAGADDYVPKPIKPRELQARLTAVAHRPSPALASEPAPAWTPAPEDPHRSAYLRLVSAGESPAGVVPEVAGLVDHPGRDVMLEAGIRFVGSWIEFRGLRINPARSIVVVDDRYVDLPDEHVRLLEVLLYCGSRMVTGREVGLRMRAETERTSTVLPERDERWVGTLVKGLRARLGDDGPEPRWFEALPEGRYRLVRPDPGFGVSWPTRPPAAKN